MAQETVKEMEERLGSSVVRYAKDLDMREVSKLTPQAQNVFSLLMAEWTKQKTEAVSIPLSVIRNLLNIKRQSIGYVDKQVLKLNTSIVLGSYIQGVNERGPFQAVLIPYIQLDLKKDLLEAHCLPQFLEAFLELSAGYAEYKTALFLQCRSKYAKNLYRIFSKNFKGRFSMNFSSFREEMGLPKKVSNGEVLRIVTRAVNELLKIGIYESIEYKPEYETKRGHPLRSISFKYSINSEKMLELHGQKQLPGLDDGAAGASPAPAAAPEATPFLAANEPRDMTHQPTAAEVAAALAASGSPISQKKKESTPACPKCGKPMILRTASSGQRFWGCSNFPKCRGSMDYVEEEK